MVNLSLAYNKSNVHHVIYNNQPVKQIIYNSNKVWDYRTAAQTQYSIGFITTSKNSMFVGTVQVPNSSVYSAGTDGESRILRGGVIAFHNATNVLTDIYFIGTQTDPLIDTCVYVYDSSFNDVNGYAPSTSSSPTIYSYYTLNTYGYNDDNANKLYTSQPAYKFTISAAATVYVAFTSYNNRITTTETLSYRVMQGKNCMRAPSISYYSSNSTSVTVTIKNVESIASYITYTNGSYSASEYVDGYGSIRVTARVTASALNASVTFTAYIYPYNNEYYGPSNTTTYTYIPGAI